MIDVGRTSPYQSTREVMDEDLGIVTLADAAGFDAVFCGEHHGIELTIAPNPFIQLAAWAQHTERIRLGTAVLSAPYWHPLRLAGEAAFVDQLSGGRLEIGIGRGAYQYEFERMGNGISPEEARERIAELVPAVKALWRGDYAHDGPAFRFPTATAAPKVVQEPHPPIWIAARHPDVFALAVANRCDVMATPLHWPFAEVVSLRERLDAAIADGGGAWRPRFMVLRDTFVYEDESEWRVPVDLVRDHARYFETLFRNVGGVHNGFVEPADFSTFDDREGYEPEALWENHVFGTPAEVIEKLRRYEAAGVDRFLLGVGPHRLTRRSLELFVSEVMPAFAADRAEVRA